MKLSALPVRRLLALAVGMVIVLLSWLAFPQPTGAQAGCTPQEWEGRSLGPPLYICRAGAHTDCSGAIIWCPPLY